MPAMAMGIDESVIAITSYTFSLAIFTVCFSNAFSGVFSSAFL